MIARFVAEVSLCRCFPLIQTVDLLSFPFRTVSTLSVCHILPSFSCFIISLIFFFLLSVYLKHFTCPVPPHHPPSLFLPFFLSPHASVSSVSWQLWWGTESLFLVRNLHGLPPSVCFPISFLSFFFFTPSLFPFNYHGEVSFSSILISSSHLSKSNASFSSVQLLLGLSGCCRLLLFLLWHQTKAGSYKEMVSTSEKWWDCSAALWCLQLGFSRCFSLILHFTTMCLLLLL